jgi:ribosomal protein L29
MEKEELKARLAHLEESLRVLHFKVEGSKSKNVKEAMALKKQIARVLTELNNKKPKAAK